MGIPSLMHNLGQILIANRGYGKRMFGNGKVQQDDKGTGTQELLDLGCKNSRDHTHNPNPPTRLEGLNMGKEFTVVSVVVDIGLLIVMKEVLVQGNGGHHPLYLGIVQAAQTLHKLEEGDHVLVAADGGEYVGGFEVFFEHGQVLMVDNDVCLCHILVILFLLVLVFGMLPFP